MPGFEEDIFELELEGPLKLHDLYWTLFQGFLPVMYLIRSWYLEYTNCMLTNVLFSSSSGKEKRFCRNKNDKFIVLLHLMTSKINFLIFFPQHLSC